MLVMTSASTFIQLSKAWFYLAKYLSLNLVSWTQLLLLWGNQCLSCSWSLFSFEHRPLNHCWALRLPLLGVCNSHAILVGMRAWVLLHFRVLGNFRFMKRDFVVGRKKKRSRKDHSPGQSWSREAVGKPLTVPSHDEGWLLQKRERSKRDHSDRENVGKQK